MVAGVGFAAALLVGFAGQRRYDAKVRAQHPAPGSFALVDGHRLHYRLGGAGRFTFVLEAGLGDYSGSWGALEPALARMGRVFVYDRAGLGWSEPGPSPRTPQRIAAELHQLLETAGVPKPWILVGHSSGGVSQVLCTMDHPGDVAGLLLIDPSHKDQFQRMPPPPFLFKLLIPQLARTAPVGLPQLLAGSPDPMQNQSGHVAASGAELRALLGMAETWGDRPLNLGRTPLYVLTAGNAETAPGKAEAEIRQARAVWTTLHEELVNASSSDIRRHLVVPDAGHYIHRTHPSAVVEAAGELTRRLQAATP